MFVPSHEFDNDCYIIIRDGDLNGLEMAMARPSFFSFIFYTIMLYISIYKLYGLSLNFAWLSGRVMRPAA
jgi:hypothetical protein